MNKEREHKSGITLAYWFDGQGRTLTLARTPKGELFWIGSTAELENLAKKYTDHKFYRENEGNYVAWMMRQLKRYLMGETSVVASNLDYDETHYMADA